MSDEIGLVVNLTPAFIHYDIIKKMLLAGKHVWTEKDHGRHGGRGPGAGGLRGGIVMKFGIQLFGILNNSQGDTMEILRELRALGFSQIEPCISPDERFIAVSHSNKEEPWASRVYVLPIAGGEPRLVTESAPSCLHGWSPDGKEFAYCAFREHEGKTEVDVYAIPAEGGVGSTAADLGTDHPI